MNDLELFSEVLGIVDRQAIYVIDIKQYIKDNVFADSWLVYSFDNQKSKNKQYESFFEGVFNPSILDSKFTILLYMFYQYEKCSLLTDFDKKNIIELTMNIASYAICSSKTDIIFADFIDKMNFKIVNYKSFEVFNNSKNIHLSLCKKKILGLYEQSLLLVSKQSKQQYF